MTLPLFLILTDLSDCDSNEAQRSLNDAMCLPDIWHGD